MSESDRDALERLKKRYRRVRAPATLAARLRVAAEVAPRRRRSAALPLAAGIAAVAAGLAVFLAAGLLNRPQPAVNPVSGLPTLPRLGRALSLSPVRSRLTPTAPRGTTLPILPKTPRPRDDQSGQRNQKPAAGAERNS